jgi:hypothetical protein
VLQVRDTSRVFDTQLESERCFQQSLGPPDLVKAPVRSTEIRRCLFVVAQHIGLMTWMPFDSISCLAAHTSSTWLPTTGQLWNW